MQIPINPHPIFYTTLHSLFALVGLLLIICWLSASKELPYYYQLLVISVVTVVSLTVILHVLSKGLEWLMPILLFLLVLNLLGLLVGGDDTGIRISNEVLYTLLGSIIGLIGSIIRDTLSERPSQEEGVKCAGDSFEEYLRRYRRRYKPKRFITIAGGGKRLTDTEYKEILRAVEK